MSAGLLLLALSTYTRQAVGLTSTLGTVRVGGADEDDACVGVLGAVLGRERRDPGPEPEGGGRRHHLERERRKGSAAQCDERPAGAGHRPRRRPLLAGVGAIL